MLTGFFVLIIGIGFGLSLVYGSPSLLYIAITISLAMNIMAYWFSDKMVLSMANAKQIKTKDDYPELYVTLEYLCRVANLPMPTLYIIDDPAPNAFATGRDKDHAAVAVTTGILPLLSKSELE